MSKTLMFSVIGAMMMCSVLGTVVIVTHGRASNDDMEWRWTKEKANFEFCVKQHLANYDVETKPTNDGWIRKTMTVTIRTKAEKKVLYLFNAHSETPLARSGDLLFFAELSPISQGCELTAVDLKTGTQIWNTRLQGNRPVMHSEYRNMVNIETDGAKVIVYGNEQAGRYVEYVDIRTGRTLANKKLKADYESLQR